MPLSSNLSLLLYVYTKRGENEYVVVLVDVDH